MAIIVCEGQDDKIFIKQFLKHLKIKNEDYNFDQHIQITHGKSHLLKEKTYENNLSKTVAEKKVKKVLFVFDADFSDDDKITGGLKKSESAIKELIKKIKWDIETDYYIFDKNLDDFIIKTLGNKQQCFEDFDKCLGIEKENKNKKISTCIYKKLYPDSPYDFSHKNFNALEEKLKTLFDFKTNDS